MEELIWKFLDGECTADERLEVENLLVTNDEFKSMFRQLTLIDTNMKQADLPDLNPEFKAKLIQSAEYQLSTKTISTSFLSFQGALALIVFISASIFISINYANKSIEVQPVFQIIQDINPDILAMTSYITIGLLLLLALDKVISMSSGRKKTSIFL